MNKFTFESDSLIPLRDVVYKTLRDAILKGELKPGRRLMEIQLAEDLGVSRTPVREAIRMLEKEGLAVIYPRRGAQVANMSIKDLKDVIEIRKALDVLAVTKACDNADEEVIKRLTQELEEFKGALSGENLRRIVELDESFHNVIYECANNPKLTAAIVSLREQMYRYRFEYIKKKSMLTTLLAEHENILNGIRNCDKEYVIKIMNQHLDNQYNAVKQLIESRGS